MQQSSKQDARSPCKSQLFFLKSVWIKNLFFYFLHYIAASFSINFMAFLSLVFTEMTVTPLEKYLNM